MRMHEVASSHIVEGQIVNRSLSLVATPPQACRSRAEQQQRARLSAGGAAGPWVCAGC
jgi:hypothetical protein